MTAQAALASAIPPETRQFDFWLGEWDADWEGGCGNNSIRATLGGRVVEERFHSADLALDGVSLSIYNPDLGQWQQTWVDNQGSYIDLAGGWDGERMVLATTRTRMGRVTQLRMVFFNILADQFDWVWERSVDAGTTWEQLWHIHYQRSAAQPAS